MSRMREVIQKVIEAEIQAKRLVETSQAEAEAILSTARRQSQELVARVEKEARLEAERIVEAGALEAEREKNERLGRAAAETETQVRLEGPAQQRAVESVVRCVGGFS